ncbi:hypothetical protein Csa_001095 [Cucumis sativus]|uniref:Uncharacterized protein n=1 Tax=Cucumis sativus TaxID=3659 RepID=A0A0A0LE68_CUCSA|nr:hypothetical protein Csa_001095 [Cucumis sativus]
MTHISLARTADTCPAPFAPKWSPKSPLDQRNLKPIRIRRYPAPALPFTQFPPSQRVKHELFFAIFVHFAPPYEFRIPENQLSELDLIAYLHQKSFRARVL